MNQILALFVSSAEPTHFARQNENLANLQCGRYYCVSYRHIPNRPVSEQKKITVLHTGICWCTWTKASVKFDHVTKFLNNCIQGVDSNLGLLLQYRLESLLYYNIAGNEIVLNNISTTSSFSPFSLKVFFTTDRYDHVFAQPKKSWGFDNTQLTQTYIIQTDGTNIRNNT